MNTRAAILFVTGTDTGVGKTTVSALLLAALRAAGRNIVACKPVETGCTRGANGELLAPDVALLSDAAGKPAINCYRYEMPVAPQVAAEREGPAIEFERIVSEILFAANDCDLLLVEGAGGLLVPITSEYNFADLAERCSASVLVVVGSRLGAINHSALTFEVLRSRKLPTLGYVINDLFARSGTDNESAARDTNRELLRQIAAHYGLKELGAVPYLNCGVDLSGLSRFSGEASIRQLCSAVIEYLGPL